MLKKNLILLQTFSKNKYLNVRITNLITKCIKTKINL